MPRTPQETRALFDRWAASYDIDLATGGSGILAGYGESLNEAVSLASVAAGRTSWYPASPFTRWCRRIARWHVASSREF